MILVACEGCVILKLIAFIAAGAACTFSYYFNQICYFCKQVYCKCKGHEDEQKTS